MKRLEGHWVKPFGTGMSCIDTVDAECPRGLSVEECMKQCEDSPYCNAGYHVSFDNLPLETYCVPLNTVFYQNSNFLDNVIDPNNNTKLSEDHGVHVQVFYNPERFPPNVELTNTNYLFFSNTCFIVQDRGDKGKYYLHSDFAFYPIQETAMSVILGQSGTLLFDFDLRITTASSLFFINNDEFSVLSYDIAKQTFSWNPYSGVFTPENHRYSFEDHPEGFVNEKEPFQLYNSIHAQYLSVDLDSQKLVWSKNKSLFPFSFELDPSNMVNEFSRTNWKDVPLLFPKVWKHQNEQFSDFLCSNFRNCKNRQASPTPHHGSSVIFFWVLVGLTLTVWVIIIVFTVIQKRHAITSRAT
jgi:hypothetical protein